MDQRKYVGRPTDHIQALLGSYLLGDARVKPQFYMQMRRHQIEAYDSFFNLGWPTYTGTFFIISETFNRPQLMSRHDNIQFFSSTIMLQQESIRHIRYIYSLLDILGAVGGITEVLMLCFGFFLFPISQHSFILQALRRLYKARTKDCKIFQDDCSVLKRKSTLTSSNSHGEKHKKCIANYRNIKLDFKDTLFLYLSDWFGFLYCDKCWSKSKKKRLDRLLEQGSKRIEGELNIVKILNDLRNLKILLKNSILTKEIKEKIAHTGKNIIDLDSESSESSNSGKKDVHFDSF